MKVLQVVQEVASSLANTSLDVEVVNLKRTLRNRLERVGFSQLRATELADEWLERLEEELRNRLIEWDLLGVPRPIVKTNTAATFFTFRHPSYQAIAGTQGLARDFPDIYNFIASLSPQDFLLIPLCLLYVAGCDPIIVTEGKDGGVDCIGQVTVGLTRSLCIFVQAKTSSGSIAKDTVQLEYAKFQELQTTGRFSEYLAAIGKSGSADGRAICYVIVTSAEFERPAREYALTKGFLLRSRRQAAFWLSQNFSLNNLLNIQKDISATLVRNLSRNLAPIIASYRFNGKL